MRSRAWTRGARGDRGIPRGAAAEDLILRCRFEARGARSRGPGCASTWWDKGELQGLLKLAESACARSDRARDGSFGKPLGAATIRGSPDQRRRGRLAAHAAAVPQAVPRCGQRRPARRVRAHGRVRGLFGAALEDGVGRRPSWPYRAPHPLTIARWIESIVALPYFSLSQTMNAGSTTLTKAR